ncbi:helix-turn-helix transcriptional regulator [Clostridium botulinum]|uniref:Transcriptional regulator n=1 Tax=Clostridium botulinum (strain Eklund 17B / Type B) TaxID=935198 RepID=B2TRZ5_CLOBB|nr:transcriptional regulator [Clostridium botulinum B str. Eklund 17B (NRP)]MBY6975808.1 helix-turn-helix transcriptional regulator [Clostridium botulinum]MBY7000231.1 helix-turn-helix transcriptional regulator [Clostridium botulinum]MCR1272989.1 helix-turn-helix domain-containing protein [Clostridium botulinum]NFD71506.1 helix-turn-helix transcriptional regulator [Clostridium botulinum]
MNNRLKEIRLHFNKTQEEFANSINIKSKAHISALESGKRSITDRIISDVCNQYNINEDWLRNGIKPMLVQTPNDELKQFALKYKFNDIEYKFLSEYVKLDVDKRSDLVGFLENIMNSDASLVADTKRKIEKIYNDNELAATKEEVSNSIDAEVEAYRQELEAESKGEILSASEKRKNA